MSRSFITECLVLKSINYKEADKIFTLFTKSDGKVNAIAKGVRKPASRKSGNLDIFDYSRISLSEWRDFYIIEQAEVINPYERLKRNLRSQGFLYLIGESLDKLLPYREEYGQLFNKVIAKFGELSKLDDERSVTINVLITILSDLGYWSKEFPEDLEYIKRYIESLADNALSSYDLLERISELG